MRKAFQKQKIKNLNYIIETYHVYVYLKVFH